MAIRTAKQERAQSLVISQLADSPQYLDLITWIAEEFDGVDDVLHYISGINVYEAEGKWLDLIGLIVGQPRTIDNAILVEYFGFDDYAGTLGFDDGRFYAEGEPLTASSVLADPEYRLLILARIARNYGEIDVAGVVESVQNLTNVNLVMLQPRYPAKFELYIGAQITSTVKAIIQNNDIIPRGAGIGIAVITAGDGYNVFGFEEFGFQAFDDAPFVEDIL